MKKIVEPILLGITVLTLILYLFGVEQMKSGFGISLIVLAAYYLACSINGAITGTLDPIFNKEVYNETSARKIYLLSGLTISLGCFTLFMRVSENYYALFLPILSTILLLIAVWSIDGLFHKTSDRRHLPMLYRLGIFTAVVLLSCWVRI